MSNEPGAEGPTYTKRKFEYMQVAGQPAGLRKFDMRHTTDVDRLWTIEQSSGYDFFSTLPYTDKDTMVEEVHKQSPQRRWNEREDLEWFLKNSNKREGIMYGVVKGDVASPADIHPETGEAQGWVFAYETEFTDEQTKQLGLSDKPETPYLELSYFKHPDGENGMMASGVAQVLYDIARMNGLSDIKSGSENVAPSVRVFAEIEDENPKSIALAEKVGFKKMGVIDSTKTRMRGDEEVEEPYKTGVYEVDWKAHEAFLKSSSPFLTDSSLVL